MFCGCVWLGYARILAPQGCASLTLGCVLAPRGCASLTTGCVLAPLQGAAFPLAKFLTSAVGRCPFPLACHKRPQRGVNSPSPFMERGGRQAGGEVKEELLVF